MRIVKMKALSKQDEKKIIEYRKAFGKYERPSVTADI